MIAGLPLFIAAPALAGDGARPRTPMLLGEVPCVTIVDRQQTSTVHVDYTIPNEDTAHTEDEVEDGRRHQLLALARQAPGTPPPLWITRADVEAAQAVGLVMSAAVDADDVLAESPAWTDAWLRITQDDARLPITLEVAAAGVDWPLQGVPAGVYQLDGYTWDPALSVHTLQRGLIKIVDGPTPAADLPAVYLEWRDDLVVAEGDTLALNGCVDALDGSTLDAAWALATFSDALEWTPFLEGAAVDDGALVLPFTPPHGIGSKGVLVRATVRDPLGRAYSAYTPIPISVLEDLDGGDETTGASDTQDDSSGGEVPPPQGGCGCRQATPPWWLVLLPALGRRRRRS